MLFLLHRSRSHRGGGGYRNENGHNSSTSSAAVNTPQATANTATMAAMTTMAVTAPATTPPASASASVASLALSSSTFTASLSPASSAGTTGANTSSNANVHVDGQAKAHGPNAPLPLSLLSTMVVPSAGPSVVLSTDSSASDGVTLSLSLPATFSVSHSQSSSNSASVSSSASSHSLVSSSSAASVTAARSLPPLPPKYSSSSALQITSKQPGANSTPLNSKPTPATTKLLSLFPPSQPALPSRSLPTESNSVVSNPVLQISTVLSLAQSKPSSPPSPGINGRRECPYVNRPLPPPPPPKNSTTMPSSGRPSTSGGRRAPSSTEMSSLAPLTKPTPINHRMSRDDSFLTSQPRRAATFDTKRMSRDDMFLGSHQAAARKAAFHVPLRSQTIGEAPDLRESPPPSFPKRVYRSESLASGEIQIGMALGSPAHPPSSEQIHMVQQQHVQHRQYQPQEELSNQWKQPYSHVHAPRQHSPPGQDSHLPSESSGGTNSRPSASVQAQEEAQAQAQARAQPLVLAPEPAPAPVTTIVASKPTSPPNSSMQRSKSTRRKIFGFFGGKKQAEVKPAMPAPALPRSLTETIDNSSGVASQVSQASMSTPTERSTTRSGNRKYQPIVIPGEPEPAATNTSTTVLEAPAPSSSGLKSSPSFRSKRPFLRPKASEPAIRKRPDISNPTPGTLANSSMSSLTSNPAIAHPPVAATPSHNQHHHMHKHTLAASPYLNVDIPEASMERYSIMFGGLLQTGPSASSLLARRQATLDKLKTINDKMHHEDLERNHANALASDAYLQVGGLQRRATSPHARSPSFSLFPSKSPSVTHHQNPLNVSSGPRSPRLRSNTSPAATHSPMQAEFNFATPASQWTALRENPTGVARKVPTVSHLGLATATMSSPASAMAARSAINFDPDQSSLILDSPTEMSPRIDDRKTWKETTQELPVFKPVIQEPQWQMVSPPSAGSNSSHISNNSNGSNDSTASKPARNTESNASNSSSPATEMSIELQVDEPDSALKSAVEISIARQISISRQQREMLRPLKTSNLKGLSPVPGSPALSRSATLKLGRNEWLQETKSSTPTLVVPPEQDANYSYRSNNDTRSRSNTAPQRPEGEHRDQQSAHYLSPRSNTPAYQLAQNRKSERVILEAA